MGGVLKHSAWDSTWRFAKPSVWTENAAYTVVAFPVGDAVDYAVRYYPKGLRGPQDRVGSAATAAGAMKLAENHATAVVAALTARRQVKNPKVRRFKSVAEMRQAGVPDIFHSGADSGGVGGQTTMLYPSGEQRPFLKHSGHFLSSSADSTTLMHRKRIGEDEGEYTARGLYDIWGRRRNPGWMPGSYQAQRDWLDKVAGEEYKRQLAAHMKKGRSRSTMRYSVPDWQQELVAALGLPDEDTFKALKLKYLFGEGRKNPSARVKPTTGTHLSAGDRVRYSDEKLRHTGRHLKAGAKLRRGVVESVGASTWGGPEWAEAVVRWDDGKVEPWGAHHLSRAKKNPSRALTKNPQQPVRFTVEMVGFGPVGKETAAYNMSGRGYFTPDVAELGGNLYSWNTLRNRIGSWLETAGPTAAGYAAKKEAEVNAALAAAGHGSGNYVRVRVARVANGAGSGKKNPGASVKNPSAKAHLARMQLGASMLREQVTAAQSALARGDSASYLSWLESLREVLARVSQDAADAGQRETPYATVAQETMRQLRKAMMKKNPGRAERAEAAHTLFGGPRRKVTKRLLKGENVGYSGLAVKVVKYGKDQTVVVGTRFPQQAVPTSAIEDISAPEWSRRWDKQFWGPEGKPDDLNNSNLQTYKKNPSASALAKLDSATLAARTSRAGWHDTTPAGRTKLLAYLNEMRRRLGQEPLSFAEYVRDAFSATETINAFNTRFGAKKNPGFSDYLAAGKRAAAGAIASAADSARTAIESAKQAAAEEATRVRVQPITEDQAIRFLAKSHGLTITNPKRGEVDELHVRFNGTAGYHAMPATPGNVAKVGTAEGIAYLREWGKKLLGRPVNAIDVELVKRGSRKGKRVLLVDEWSGWHTRALNPRANPSSHIGDIIRVHTGPSTLHHTPGFEANYRVLEVSNDPGRARRPIKVASTTNEHGKKGAVHWISVDQIVKVVRRAK